MMKATRELGESSEMGRLYGFLEGGRGLLPVIYGAFIIPVFHQMGEGVAAFRAVVWYFVILGLACAVFAWFGINSTEEQNYHVHLQKNSQEEFLHTNSIKRSYGYVLDPVKMKDNCFSVQREYVSIGNGSYQHTPETHIMTIPAGQYACFTTYVCKDAADFSPLLHWLEAAGRKAEFVIADEIGLQLFYYNQYNYPCEIKAYLGPEAPQGKAFYLHYD